MATERLDIVISERGSRTVRRDIAAIGTQAAGLQSVLAGLRTAILGIAVAFGGRAMVNTWRDFGQTMATVHGITRATATEFQMLREQARHLGATTRFTASQVGESQLFLARAGFSVNQILEATPGTLSLAIAGALDLGRAADIVTNILTAFRGEVAELPRFLDVLATAANSSNTNIEQLGLGMKYVAPLAAGMGVSLEEVAAAAGALSDAGLQATMFGTGMRRIFSELESPSTKTLRILRALGIEAERLRPSRWAEQGMEFADALEMMADAGVGTGLALEIFGDRGGPAFEALASQTDKVRGLTARLNEAEGSMNALVAVMSDTLYGSLVGLQSAVEGVVLTIGSLGGEALVRGVVDVLTAAFRKLADILVALSPIIYAVGGALTVFWAARLAPIALTAAVALLSRGIAALWVVIRAHPLGALLTAIAAVGIHLFNMRNEIKLTSDGVVSLGDAAGVVWDDLVAGAGDMVSEVIGLFRTMSASAQRDLDDIGESGSDNWEWIANKFQDMLVSIVLGLFQLRAQVRVLWGDIRAIVEGEEVNWHTLGQRLSQAAIEGLREGAEYIRGFEARARARAAGREEESRTSTVYGYNEIDPRAIDPAEVRELTRADILERFNRELEDNLRLTRLDSQERRVQQQIIDLNNELRENEFEIVSGPAREALESEIRLLQHETERMKLRDDIMAQAVDRYEELALRIDELNRLVQQGGPLTGEFERQLRAANIEMLQMRIDAGQGGFADGFLLEIAKMLQGVENFTARAGQALGQFYSNMIDGFANSVGRAIVYAEDLDEALINVARSALAELIGALVKMGIQWLLNATLGQTIAAAMAAASVAEAGVVAAAWAPAAAAVSLASFGANAAPAMTGIISTFGLTQSLAALGTAGLADGGLVVGPGGPRSDRVPALLSNGEFVMNAAATARNRAVLEAMNRGAQVGGGISIAINTTVQGGGGDPARQGAEVARQVERVLLPLLMKHTRPGGALAKPVQG